MSIEWQLQKRLLATYSKQREIPVSEGKAGKDTKLLMATIAH
jgi:hypothetical protein